MGLVSKAKATPADIEALAAKAEPAVAKAVLAALEAQADSIDLDALAAALLAGDAVAVEAMVTSAGFASKLGPVGAALEETAWTSGAATITGGVALAAAKHAPVAGVSFQFDRLNPRLVTWLQTYKLDLIRQISDATRDGVREVLVDGMRAGINPKEQARRIKEIVGLTERQSRAVANFRKELEVFHLRRGAGGMNLGAAIDRVNGTQVFKPDKVGNPKDGILERRLRDFRYDKQLAAAMKGGKPLTPAQIDKMTAAYAKKYRAFRARTIARTEALRATNMGVQEGWRQGILTGNVAEGLVRRRWIVARDERLCEMCNSAVSMNPKIGVPFGAPFASLKGPVMLPPMHPQCRCTVWIRAVEPEMLAP
jgi:hypothetical protein